MKININDFQNALNVIFERLKDDNGENFELELNEDYYNFIPTEKLYNIDGLTVEVTIGSLFEDFELLNKFKSESHYSVPTDLIKFSSLIRYIGENLV